MKKNNCLFLIFNYFLIYKKYKGNCHKLEYLFINGNSFEEIPISLANLKNLKDFSLDWFKYCQPPLEEITIIQKEKEKFTKFKNLCDLIKKKK